MRRTIFHETIIVPAAVFLVLALAALPALGAPDPGTENFTSISTSGHIGSDYPSFHTNTLNGSTTVTSPQHLKTANLTFNSPGSLDGEGFADFGTLKSSVVLEGPSGQHGHSKSVFNDHWTVTNPALTGTQGTMQLAFDISGMTTVLDTFGDPVASNAWSQLSLLVDLNANSGSNGTRVLSFEPQLDPGPTNVVASPGGPTISDPITFTYGVPFGIRVSLYVWAQSDNHYLGYTFTPSYFEYYGGGTIDSVTVDFLSTAELIAIVIPDDPAARVLGDSATNYTGLVSTEVPLPATLWLVLAGLPLLGRRRRRKS